MNLLRVSRRFLLAGCAFAGMAVAQANADSLARGQQLFVQRDLPRAEAMTRRVLVAEPKSAEAMYLLGNILEAEKNAQESLQWFTRAAALKPPHGEDLRVVAMDYVLLSAYPKALHWLQRSVQLDPSNAEAWYDLGRAKMQQGDLHGARLPLERALALKPGQMKVVNNLGVVAEADNQPKKAEALYRQAIGLQATEPHPSAQPMLNLGTLLLTQAKAAEALPFLLEAAKLAPTDVKMHEQLARAEEQQGREAEAINQLELALRLEPQSAALHYQLGQIYRRAGFAEKAKAELLLSGKLYGTKSNDDNR